MVDPTSDLGEDLTEEEAPRCAWCEEPAFGVGRRVVTRVVDGQIEHVHFCGDACRTAWQRDERETTHP
jgi:hypothetical protein